MGDFFFFLFVRQCAPRVRVTYRPPGFVVKRDALLQPQPVQAERSLPLPSGAVLLPSASTVLLLGRTNVVTFQTSAATVTSFVAYTLDGGESYLIACARVDAPSTSCEFVPAANTSGTVTVRVIFYNAQGGPFAAFSPAVPLQNPAPTVSSFSASALQGSETVIPVPFSFGLAAASASLSIVEGPAVGTAVVRANREIVFSSSRNSVAPVAVSVQVCDSLQVCSAVAVVSITVIGVPPRAFGDVASLNQGGSSAVAVLLNDVAGVAAVSSVEIVAAPSRGNVSVLGDMRVSYQSAQACWNGGDVFSYRICDVSGQCSGSAVVSLQHVLAPALQLVSESFVLGRSPAILALQSPSSVCSQLALPSIVQAPRSALATASVQPNGSIFFTPLASGSSFFLYTQCDTSLPTARCAASPYVFLFVQSFGGLFHFFIF